MSTSNRAVAAGPDQSIRSGASFRDPSGFVFSRNGTLYRQVNDVFRADYEWMMSSGLYEALVTAGDLVHHEEVDAPFAAPDGWRVLEPHRIPFISYPYEWCFGQVKAAALLTLRLQRTAMTFGMSLKDATAYNVQFEGPRPIWIDTLSFEQLRDGRPWVAYRQFCEFFLGPLALMRYADERLHLLLRTFIDGVPVRLASRLLPRRSWLNPGLAVHIHLHAGAAKYADVNSPPSDWRQGRLGRAGVLGLLDSLERTVNGLSWVPEGTVWADYYDSTNYTAEAFECKRQLVRAALDRLRPATVWDVGANTGTFSRLASDRGIRTIAFDVDAAAVEKNYRRVVEMQEQTLCPLLLDLTNPSAAIGWANQERLSLAERGPADTMMALALIHHLAIGHNVPFCQIAEYFAALARSLVVEWVPKDDSQVQRMLTSRDDVFGDYDEEHFRAAFSRAFRILDATPIDGSLRKIYLMERHTS
jgi:ribosomal protein L11 methylase PrmA